MQSLIIAFLSGIIFAIGLALSQMIHPEKVKAFLDVTGGNWDPSLAFVMIGAIGINLLLFPYILKRKRPISDEQFYLPKKTKIDKELIIGASCFGIGWGLIGLCPGPAIVNLTSKNNSIILFVAAMMVGFAIFQISNNFMTKEKK